MCALLGTGIIGASSPQALLSQGVGGQAKGRVERSNGTQQDRLIKKLRLYRIGTVQAANRYLRQYYLPRPAGAVRAPAPARRGRLSPPEAEQSGIRCNLPDRAGTDHPGAPGLGGAVRGAISASRTGEPVCTSRRKGNRFGGTRWRVADSVSGPAGEVDRDPTTGALAGARPERQGSCGGSQEGAPARQRSSVEEVETILAAGPSNWVRSARVYLLHHKATFLTRFDTRREFC